MPERGPHYLSLAVAILAGCWTALNTPATHLFEQATRTLDLTGQLLSPLNLLSDAAATFLVMSAVYLVLTEAFARAGFRAADRDPRN